jgi:hypothetical protein
MLVQAPFAHLGSLWQIIDLTLLIPSGPSIDVMLLKFVLLLTLGLARECAQKSTEEIITGSIG